MSIVEDFASFAEEKARSAPSRRDRERAVDEWRQAVSGLLAELRGHLEDFVARGTVRVEERSATVEEEILGAYVMPALDVAIGSDVIRIEPVGRNVIGARGRVDIIGPLRTARLLRDATGRGKGWTLASPRPSTDMSTLDREAFLSALMAVARA